MSSAQTSFASPTSQALHLRDLASRPCYRDALETLIISRLGVYHEAVYFYCVNDVSLLRLNNYIYIYIYIISSTLVNENG